MTKADQHPGSGQPSAGERSEARINEAFKLFDRLLPPDSEWSDKTAVPLSITSNNPLVDGTGSDHKQALFNPRFSIRAQGFEAEGIPYRLHIAKYKVAVPDDLGGAGHQYRRHIELERIAETNAGITRPRRTFVLHEPSVTQKRTFPRRLETGLSRTMYGDDSVPESIEFSTMRITDGEETLTVLDLLTRATGGAVSDQEAAHRNLTESDTAARRQRILEVMRRRATAASVGRRHFTNLSVSEDVDLHEANRRRENKDDDRYVADI